MLCWLLVVVGVGIECGVGGVRVIVRGGGGRVYNYVFEFVFYGDGDVIVGFNDGWFDCMIFLLCFGFFVFFGVCFLIGGERERVVGFKF